MHTNTIITTLGPGDKVEARRDKRGELVIAFGTSLYVWVDEETNPTEYARLCKAFGLQNETAPGDQTESGVPGGNEPAQEMVPQKVQV